jgi:transposase-like protein
MDGIEAGGDGRQSVEAGKRIRRQWTAREKRQIVREVQRAGAVKQEVAQRHGVHVSVLNRWRTEERGKASGAKKEVNAARLLSVQVRRARPVAPRRALDATLAGISKFDMMEVEFSSGRRLTVRGVVDAWTLRTVLQELSQ